MRKLSLLALLTVAVLIFPSQQLNAAIHYVKAGATGTGTSWTDATGDLQAAIDAATSGDQVWVAAGTYAPDSLIRSNKPTSRAFFLKDGVSLYGGFAGTETTLEQRQTGANAYDFVNATILSGDDDVPDVWVREIAAGTSFRLTWQVENDQVIGTKNNAAHVLYGADVISNRTVIDGFTITGGNANVWQAKAYGGGIYAQGNVVINACRLVENSGYFSAQSYTDSNTYGGALFLNGAADAAVTNCYFARNYSHSSYGNGVGGAMYVGNARVENCYFEDCVADDAGGAIYSSGTTISGCTFVNCYGGSGGAVYNNGTLTRCFIYDCRGLLGGGIYNLGTASYNIVANCYADAPEYGDYMGGRGGGILNAQGMVLGSVVYNNTAFWGGGVYCLEGKVVNSTIQNNTNRFEADTANVGLLNRERLAELVLNTIGDPDTTAANFVAPTSFKGVATTAADSAAIRTANWALADGSVFIDAGTLTDGVTESTDIAGNPRVMGESIDVGAYEHEAAAKPTMTITVAEAGQSLRLGIGGNSGDKFFIDWGNGEKAEYSSAAYYTNTVTGNTVKVYGDAILILQAVNQGITGVDFNGASALTRIQLGSNAITSLDLTGCTALTGLYAEDNAIEALNLTGCDALRVIDVHNNKIGGKIDCTAMSALSKIDIADNQVEELILPSQTALYSVDCSNNRLSTLSLPGLTGLDELSCHTNQLTELNISDLTALTELYAYDNQLTEADVTACTKLETLNLAGNRLTAIDLSKNAALTGVYLYDNELAELDITANPNVRWLNISNNHLEAINTSRQASLSLLFADNNKIAAVDLQNNPSVSQLKLSHNRLTAINVDKQSYLSWFKVDNNEIETLNLTNNAYLYWLECDSNKIAALDLSKNTYLQWLAAEGNLLTELDLAANKGLQGLTLQGNMMSGDALNSIIDQLQDVSGVTITDNNRSWGRQLNISYMPGTRQARTADAEAKGWIVTALYNVIPGDVNGDGQVNAADVTALYNYILNGDETYLAASDVNGDGAVNAGDVTAVYNIILGL